MGLGGRSTSWSSKGSGDKVLENYIEDMFIDAIDRKYHGGSRQSMVIVEYLEEGMSEQDIASLIGTSERNIRRKIKKIREELADGNKG